MAMPKMPKDKGGLVDMAYLVGTAGFLLGWVIALCGLAAVQNDCAKHETAYLGMTGTSGVLASTLGTDCSKLFRFVWFVLFLGILPVLLDVAGIATGRKSGMVFYASLVPLFVFMANMFYNLVDVDALNNTAERRIKVALCGFAIAAGMALLQMIGGAMIGDHDHHEEHKSFTTAGATDKPAVAAPGGQLPV